MLQAFYSMQIFASERCKMTTCLSDIIPHVANILQFADGSFVPMQILCDGRVPSNELMLHKTMQCTGVSCKAQQNVASTAQILRSLEILTPSDQNMYADLFSVWFGPSSQQKELLSPFTVLVFAQEAASTEGCLHTWMLLCRDAFRKDMFWHTAVVLLQTNAFMHRCFYTGMLLPAGAITHRCAGISTHRCL